MGFLSETLDRPFDHTTGPNSSRTIAYDHPISSLCCAALVIRPLYLGA